MLVYFERKEQRISVITVNVSMHMLLYTTSIGKILARLWYQINLRNPPKLICILLYETPWGYCAFHVLSTSTLLDFLVFTFPTGIIVPFDFLPSSPPYILPPILLSYPQHFSSLAILSLQLSFQYLVQ